MKASLSVWKVYCNNIGAASCYTRHISHTAIMNPDTHIYIHIHIYIIRGKTFFSRYLPTTECDKMTHSSEDIERREREREMHIHLHRSVLLCVAAAVTSSWWTMLRFSNNSSSTTVVPINHQCAQFTHCWKLPLLLLLHDTQVQITYSIQHTNIIRRTHLRSFFTRKMHVGNHFLLDTNKVADDVVWHLSVSSSIVQ